MQAEPALDEILVEFSPQIGKKETKKIPFDKDFVSCYRTDVVKYHDEFIKNDAVFIDKYISDNFKAFPKYLVSTGIGADEMASHFISQLNNKDPNRKLTWIVVDAPSQLNLVPKDANPENTLFVEASRSGKTEETVKTHELTSLEYKRIILANSGPLFELGKRDKCLTLNIPPETPGRFGRNKTPILLAPMYIAGLNTKKYWETTASVIGKWDLTAGLPAQIASFIHKRRRVNHIYLGCPTGNLLAIADELIQFWNEGVCKNGNDILMSRYLGLPRDSHTTIEGVLGNAKTKLAIFLLPEINTEKVPSIAWEKVDPINPKHQGLTFDQVEKILLEANYNHFAKLMPTIGIRIKGKPNYLHSAILGQLWADVAYCYAKLTRVDPGSNPEVQHVRDRSAQLLAEKRGF